MNKKIHKSALISGILVALSFLPGCALTDMFKGSSVPEVTEPKAEIESSVVEDQPVMTGEVLVTLKGKPVITTDSLAAEKEKYFKSQPQLVEVLRQMDPKEFDHYLMDGLIGQCIADEFVKSNKINQTTAYQSDLKDLYKLMERTLNARYFNDQIVVSVSDGDVRSFYETNKNKMQGVVLSQGGVAAQGIEFGNLADARAFVDKVRAESNNFKKVAQDDNLTAKIKDFKLVNPQSIGIDEQLRDKIVGLKTFPTVEVMEANGKFWAILAMAKEEAKYMPYEQIKDRLKPQLEQIKRAEMIEKKVNELRAEYGVTVNEDYFKPEGQEERGAMSGGVAQATQVQEPVSKRVA